MNNRFEEICSGRDDRASPFLSSCIDRVQSWNGKDLFKRRNIYLLEDNRIFFKNNIIIIQTEFLKILLKHLFHSKKDHLLMFQSTSSSREEEVEFSTKFSVIEAKPEIVWLPFYHSVATLFLLPPHISLSFLFLSSSIIRPLPQQRSMLKFIVEIRRRQNRGWRFSPLFFISTNGETSCEI